MFIPRYQSTLKFRLNLGLIGFNIESKSPQERRKGGREAASLLGKPGLNHILKGIFYFVISKLLWVREKNP